MQVFKAKAIAAEEMADLNAFCLVLAEEADGTGFRLEIQRALSVDEQDRALGQDTYCLVTETGASHYGGVKVWRLERGILEIRLQSEAAEALGVEGGFSIQINSESLSLVYATMMKLVS